MKSEEFKKFEKLIRNQFEYGNKKYGLDEERESTDVIFDKHGKNWLFGTIDKYTFRYKNLSRERDLLKIACYMYILWLKRGFHIRYGGINDPAIDTSIKNKRDNFNKFIEEYISSSYPMGSGFHFISDILGSFSKKEWKRIESYYIKEIFHYAFLEWKNKFSNIEKHDTDTKNEYIK